MSDLTGSVNGMAETTTNIHEALTNVIRDLPGIGKDSSGKGLQYSYRGIEDIVPVVKRLFAEHGIHMTANHSIVTDDDKQGNSGKQRRVVLQSTFLFHATDGSFVSTTTIGEAMDVQDKAMNKAMTAAYKYALIQTLTIADGDDPDAYQPEQQHAAPVEIPMPDGHLSVADAKTEFLNACDGDTACAKEQWQAAGLTPVTVGGHDFYSVTDVLAAVDAAKQSKAAMEAPFEDPAGPGSEAAANAGAARPEDTNPFPEPDRG